MAQKDWLEILSKLDQKSSGILDRFLKSDEIFFPSAKLPNPFDLSSGNITATQLEKPNPANWIPVYRSSDLPPIMRTAAIFPVRSGPGEFFFCKGNPFFDLQKISWMIVDTGTIDPIDSFIPATLTARFQRNENAYLNKAVALGYMNHFVDTDRLKILEKILETKRYRRLLYGQFGKIKITTPLRFDISGATKTIAAGFQFEIDLVLENENEVIIFEAKTGPRPQKEFSLLQLYYPLLYFRSLLPDKKIRTVFIDIVANEEKETYRLVEFSFDRMRFDALKTLAARSYTSKP